jgi:hypothetical protein
MNKIYKIGLTALAGSLASIVGANAGALSIAGGSDITWISKDSNTTANLGETGNPIGWKNNVTLTGAGELDNGISWTANAYNSDAQALTSSNISFDLGGMGALLIDNGAGGAGLDALDDKAPTAWEETHGTGSDSGVVTVTGVHGSASLTYTTPADVLPYGAKVRIGYTPRADGGGLQADLGTSGAAGNGSGDEMDITLEMAPSDMISVYAGYADRDTDGKQSGNADGSGNVEEGTYGLTITAGAITAGIQQSYISNTNGGTAAVGYYDNLNWGVAFNVNDQLSISYAEYESTEENLGSVGATVTTGQTLEIDSFQIAYNMGGATIKLADTSTSDNKYTAGAETDVTTVALALAF